MQDIIGFGALNVDLIYEVSDLSLLNKGRFSFTPGSEIYGNFDDFSSTLKLIEKVGKLKSKSGGGQAANTILALSKMGFKTGYVGKIGKDEYGEFIIQHLGFVDTGQISYGEFTGLCLSILDKTKDRSLLILPNSNDCLKYEEVDLNYIKKTKFLHLTSFVGDLPFDAQKKIAAEISDKVKISFDPGELYAKRGITELLPIIKNSYILFPSDQEIKLLTGLDYKKGARKLLDYGPQIVACTRGEKGSYILTRNEEFEIQAEKVAIVDKTGAGDVYAAGFLAGLLLERSVLECAMIAAKAAGLSITGYGREKYPDKIWLKNLLNSF